MAEERDGIIAEYKVCQDIVARSTSSSWQSAALILGFALTGAILVFSRQSDTDLSGAILVTLMGVGVVVVLCRFYNYMRRERWRQSVAIWRAVQTEKRMGGWVVTGIGVLDHWMKKHTKKAVEQLPAEARDLLRNYQYPSGWPCIRCLVIFVGITWLSVVGWEWYQYTISL